MKNHTSEEIKNRLSNIGEAIGSIALEYIGELEKENEQLKQQIEKTKCCHSCKSHKLNDLKNCQTCDDNYSGWRLAE